MLESGAMSDQVTRRTAVRAAAAFGILSSATKIGLQAEAAAAGRLNQSVCKWCYRDMSLEDLAKQGAKFGIRAIDLLTEDQWPEIAKYGLVCSMGSGACTIPDGLNVAENHPKIEENLRRMLPLAKQYKVPNLIVFSGNRREVSDEQGWEQCEKFLRKIVPQAEDLGVTIQMELLNSKVNHPDYQCDTTRWGVELVRRVNSPRFKLLYDIYHMQIMEGDVIRVIRDHGDAFGHYHTGGNPGRNEIDETQELNYTAISKAIADLGYDGWFAHEFIPLRDPITSLRQAVKICTV